MGLIYLDSCLVIYAFEDDEERGRRTRAMLADGKERQFAVSPLVIMECLVGPMRTANLVLQRYYEEGLEQFERVSLGEDVFRRAAELRARAGLRTPDAVHLAAAQVHRCEALWTNDDRMVTASHGLARGVLVGQP